MSEVTRYIAYDTETGGLDPRETDLLTAYFAILDETLTPVAELDLKLKPGPLDPKDGPSKDRPYRVTAGALGVNRINLLSHNVDAIPYAEGAKQLERLITNYKPEGRWGKLIPIGHNVPFDDGFVQEYLLKKADWEKCVDYRKVDTCVVANFLKLCGRLNVKSVALESLCEYFKFPSVGAAHNAKNDTISTIMVLRELRKIVGGQQLAA